MLQSFKVGRSQGSSENLNRSYAYNSFGDLTALTEDTTSYAFTYDGLGRLTAAYGRTYSYDGANRLTAFNGQSYGYGDAGPYHAVDRIGNADRFDYDANGNMTKRNKGLDSQQTLVWNAENRLSEVQDNNGNLIESYWYDIGGARVKKTSGATTTYTFFGHYEEEVSGGSTTEIRHYSFGSLRIAVKRGSTLYHLHGDHLGSTSLTTAGSAVEASRAYYAYGAERSASGDLKTDRTFTGQKSDASGLLYYNARYYDPALGTFISPDSLVPNAGRIIDYNRFLYARGNPLKYTDPTGHSALGPSWVQEFTDVHGRPPNNSDRSDRLVSFVVPGSGPGRSWTGDDWIRYTAAKVVGKYIVDKMNENAGKIAGIQTAVKIRNAFAQTNAESPFHLWALGAAFAGLAAYFLWAQNVGTDKEWDHKKDILKSFGKWHQRGEFAYRYDIWSNIHFGYIAKVIGFEEFEMLAGAGIAQIGDNLFHNGPLEPEWLNLTNFGDDPYDQESIKVGFALHAEVSANEKLTYEIFWAVFDAHASKLPRCPVGNVTPTCAAWED